MARRNLQEQIERMKKLSKVHLKEASYKAVLSDEFNSDNDDSLSRSIYSAGPEPQTANNSNIFDSVNEDGEADLPSGITSPPPAGTGATGSELSAPAPSADAQTGSELDMMGTDLPVDTDLMAAAPEDGRANMDSSPLDSSMPVEPTKSREEVQNELLHIQVAAMQKLNDKLGELDNMFSLLNNKYEQLNKEVEEVREPSDAEKLKSRKVDSHPYYFNLNDMWQNNYFQSRQDQFGTGMIKLDDGTYVADFDNLPKLSDKEIKDSFMNY
ncbi:MAG: hypothetical protein HC836_28020 [Richelia sp. RM2_1_2]|nr:hypothetical protein [Richelia sp. RM2_1_2]